MLDRTALENEARVLQARLQLVDLNTAAEEIVAGGAVPALVFALGELRVRMRRESSHARPHFHLEYKREFAASYAIDTLERLAGEMPSRYEQTIVLWATERRPRLLAIWKALQTGGPELQTALDGIRA